MDTGWVLRNSIHLLNEFCADSETFSFKVLPFLKLERLGLRVTIESQELIIFVSTDPDYQMLRAHLMPEQRLYQLLSIHFKQVQIVFGSEDDPIEKAIYLETISLYSFTDSTDLRHPRTLGARLRRALNIVLQGHSVVLWLYDDTDVESFKQLWVRTRVVQLFEEHKIMPHYDSEKRLVELWKVRCSDEGDGIVITIK
jgi:hypothetical protein